MKLISILVTSFILLYYSSLSQNDYKHNFLSYGTDVEEKKSVPDYNLYRKKIHDKYDTLFNDNFKSYEFAKLLVEGLKNTFESGNLYTNWDYAEDYLNKVLKKIIPSADTDSNLNIKIIRSTEVNAFMTGTGSAYITVGFLANALSEAEIASTLGHEYGHYIHLDVYKGFQARLKNEKHRQIGSIFAGYGGNLFYLISTSNMYGNFRDAERDADKTGIALAKDANYNILAELKSMERFKMIEDNHKKDKDYHFHSYFRTHPPNDERIEYIKKAANKSDTINSKYFQVDEILFQKIKLQAIDECINLLLQQQNFEDCIELCYKQLLFNSTDEFYLFYLNEALRRFLLTKPKEADKLFITGRYNTYPKYLPKNKLPICVLGEKKLKPENEKITQTIFYHYEYLMLGDKNKLFVKLPVNELTRTDTLEFISNKDALNYFISKQEKLHQSSVSWVKNCLLDSLENININSNESFLNKYNQIKNDVINCTSKAEDYFIPCLLRNVSYSGNPTVSSSGFKGDSLLYYCREFLKETVSAPCSYFEFNPITQSERHLMSKLITGMKSYTFHKKAKNRRYVTEKIEKTEKINLPLALLAPEAVSMLNKYGLRRFVVINLQITDGLSFATVPLNYFIIFNIYYIDFKKGFLSHIMGKDMIGRYSDLKLGIDRISQCLPLSISNK
jgi:hypothetical protein